jgi:hypothetical protein
MIEKIQQFVEENKFTIVYSMFGVTVFSSYYFYLRYVLAKNYNIKLKKKQNMLDTSFRELLTSNKQPKIMKVVFTEAESSSGNFRKIVIDKIKETFPKKDMGVLINCSVIFYQYLSPRKYSIQDASHSSQVSTTMTNSMSII